MLTHDIYQLNMTGRSENVAPYREMSACFILTRYSFHGKSRFYNSDEDVGLICLISV